MRIAVIGAGIIGITSAWELASDGHAVSVFERRIAAAEEGSFANAGVVAPGYVTPWAAPGMPLKVLRHMFGRHAPVRLSLPLSGSDLSWIWRWWRACKPATYQRSRMQLQHLAFYSRERLHRISASLQLEYDRSDGYMVLLRGAAEARLVHSGLQLLRDAGIAFAEVDADQARRIEPALNAGTALHGAVHLPGDEVGNCRQFGLLLKNEALRQGVQFEFSNTVERIETGAGVALQLRGEPAPRPFDAEVVCAAVESARLLRPLGLRVPLAAVHGYSLSAAIREPLNAPRSAVMDERYKVAISRLGQRVRVAGSAQLGGRPLRQHPGAVATLYKVLQDWFPGAASLSQGVQLWKGSRPMLPDGPPLIGASGVSGVWLNLGHGSSGWALSCGSARALADLVGGRDPGLDMRGFDAARLHP